MIAEIKPGTGRGSMKAPPSKSMAHRLLICGGLADGESVIDGISSSEDMKATLDCLAAIGALGLYISDESVENFQPMNINFSIIAPLEQRIRKKAEKNLAISQRALTVIDALKGSGI